MTVMIPVREVEDMIEELRLRSKAISNYLASEITKAGLAHVLSAARFKNEIETVRTNEIYISTMGVLKRELFDGRLQVEKSEFMEYVYARLADHVGLGNLDSAKVFANLTRDTRFGLRAN